MYREKERHAASSKGSPGKSTGTSSQEQPPQPPTLVAKETAPLPPPPPQLDLSLSALDSPGMEQLEEEELEGDGEDYVELPNLDFDHGRDSPFRHAVTQRGGEGRGRMKCVTRAFGAWCVIPENAGCRNCPLLPPAFFFLSFTKILSDSPLLASIRHLIDELDDIRGHGKIIIDTSSHTPHHQCLFSS